MTGKEPLPEAKILRRQDFGPDLMKIWIERPKDFDFQPGQYCTIGSGGVERAYSIVSAPHEPDIELFIELVPLDQGGHLTPRLWDLHPGEHVTLRPKAKGRFTFHPSKPQQLLVATVTGIVPYVSMVRDYLHHGGDQHRFVIIHGASFRDELVYDGELTALAQQRPERVVYIPTVSRPSDARNQGWSGRTGRAHQLCDEVMAAHGLAADDTVVYACGHPGMVAEIEQRFGQQGFSVQVERYWKE